MNGWIVGQSFHHSRSRQGIEFLVESTEFGFQPKGCAKVKGETSNFRGRYFHDVDFDYGDNQHNIPEDSSRRCVYKYEAVNLFKPTLLLQFFCSLFFFLFLFYSFAMPIL